MVPLTDITRSFDRRVYSTGNLVPPQLQHHPPSSHQSPVPSISPCDSQTNPVHRASVPEAHFKPLNNLVGQNVASDPLGEEFVSRARSSSEEKDSMTPAQSKRKAQNRAAYVHFSLSGFLLRPCLGMLICRRDSQRAFRERKERHVKDLEAKLNDLERASASLNDENERLKHELAKVSTENKILRATNSCGPPKQSIPSGSISVRQDDEITKTGPMKYTPTDFLTAVESDHSNVKQTPNAALDDPSTTNGSFVPPSHVTSHNRKTRLISSQGSFTPSAHRISICPRTGRRLLSVGAAWDYIQAHSLFKDGLVDIADVSQRLRGLAECDGSGPCFEERAVRGAIEECAAIGKDELI